ncbi:amidohydrolase family protein [Steroidobacter sp. S1-65]|uniref:Amidohydrolase family protein n=1 Tax=Steroidobacter gossypii TaxID=2805490 RepID=A0ABS1WRW8_9GAMM|nr:amidohydrolase family protein [Steroidobacter gossypii]MBM0103722.1 amidohydrolase family protein [Steroidobacter gossypii]
MNLGRNVTRAGVLIGALCMHAWAAAATAEYSVISANEKVGSLVATIEGASVDITFEVNNNGRGPKIREQLTLNEAGIPTQWRITGKSTFGAAIDEQFTWQRGSAQWRGQDGKGSSRMPQPKLYITNDGSPWSAGLYVRTLLKAKDHTLEVAPSGTLRLEELQKTHVGDVPVTAYAITGANLAPEMVLLAADGSLFAQLSSRQVLVRTGFESKVEQLQQLERSLRVKRLEEMQRRLAHRFDVPVRIRNVRVFDPHTETLSDPVSVVVFRNRIASVAAEPSDFTPPNNEAVIDGGGGTLIAGLHDMHAHNSNESGLFYLAAGVTGVRDLGNDNQLLLDLARRIEQGELPGPRIVRAGLIEGRSSYSARIGSIPETLPEALDIVRWYSDHGYRQMKIYNSFNPDWVAPVAKEAHRLGMRVSGHVPAFMSPDRAIRDGYDEINHINQLVLGWLTGPQDDTRTTLRLTRMANFAALDLDSEQVRTTIALMKERKIALDTTTVILERLMASRAGKVQKGDAPYLDHMPIGYQRYRKRSFVEFKSKDEDQAYLDSVAKLLDLMKVLYSEGIQMLPGTDDTTGFSVHRELELYQKAGIPAAKVLRMATYDCEKYLGFEQSLGSIEAGKFADFFLVPGDPTRNVSAVRQIQLVMKDGLLYFPSEIYQALGIKPFTTAPTVSGPAT